MQTGDRSGFTLVEVLVVVAIIALLIAILMPALTQARMAGQRAGCLSNLHQIGIGMFSYAQDYRGWMPAAPADQVGWVKLGATAEWSSELQTGADWRPQLFHPWQFGGHRAGYVYTDWYTKETYPEVLPRPLTKYLSKGQGLDARTPVFECPADNGVSYWAEKVEPFLDKAEDVVVPSAPLHSIYGNSYVVAWNSTLQFRTSDLSVSEVLRNPSQTAMVTEAVMYTDAQAFDPKQVRQNPRQVGWHGKHLAYDVLSLDLHAEFKFLWVLHGDPRIVSGFQFRMLAYPYIVDYYRRH